MPTKKTFETELDVNLPVVVNYTFTSASRGARDSLGGKRGAGPPLEPDEPAEVEIESVIYKGVDIVEHVDTDDLATEILDSLADEAADDGCDREADRDDWREDR
jgi:hypothetical protein